MSSWIIRQTGQHLGEELAERYEKQLRYYGEVLGTAYRKESKGENYIFLCAERRGTSMIEIAIGYVLLI